MNLEAATNGWTEIERCGKRGMTHAIHKSRTANGLDAERNSRVQQLRPKSEFYSQSDA